tara:strand:- start:497 stop:673 length:177 start_codon:yes stop_codon:yes gene_type:complete
MVYKCECKEFEIDKATIVIIDDKVLILESYCEDCNTYGKEVKEFDGWGKITSKKGGKV